MPVSSFVMRVHNPILFPIAASDGSLLLVTPGHPTHTLAVLTADGKRVLRHRYVEHAALFSQLEQLDAEHTLTFLLPADRLKLLAFYLGGCPVSAPV